jgi:hypothetical protein
MIITILLLVGIWLLKILLPIIAIVKFCVDGDLMTAIICLVVAIMMGGASK